MNKVRVRYAPSPTGYLHIGGARSALFNFLYAKHFNGDFVFRIEDTDIERNISGAEESQLHDLIWLGIIPDESPEKPNPKYAPYRQTEKLDIYKKYADYLVKNGFAYECFCSEEELQKDRDEQLNRGIAAPKYNRHCLFLSEKEKEALKAKGIKPSIRIKMKDHYQIAFDDMVRGKVSFNTDDIGDWVIMKSNGIPTYNFAVVVDDHLMEITHVLRGEEHLSNTPKQIMLYEYFGWDIPRFGHMTIIINENGKKLSKRDLNILQFMSQYRELGYLPEAIFNFLLLLGWTSGDGKEIFSLKDAINCFDPARLSSSPSMFDQKKMMWMNATYIKAMPEDKYLNFIRPFVIKATNVPLEEKQVVALSNLFKGEILFGAEISELIKPILEPLAITSEEDLSIMSLPTSPLVIEEFAKELNEINDINVDSIKAIFSKVKDKTGVKGKPLFMPIRLKLTGVAHGAEMVNIISILGKDEVIKRLSK